MSEELRQELHNAIDKDLFKYERLVLEAFDSEGASVLTSNATKNAMCRYLVKMDILRSPYRSNGLYFYKITEKGIGIALKLKSEKMEGVNIGAGIFGYKAPDDTEVTNEPKPEPEEIRDLT